MSAPGLRHVEVSSGDKPIQAKSPSVFAVLVNTKRGIPNKPMFVTSFAQARKYFGDYSPNAYSMYVLRQLMEAHGASQVWISRVAGSGATGASASIGTTNTMDFQLTSVGTDGNDWKLVISKNPLRDEYSVSLQAPDGNKMVEIYKAEQLSSDPQDLRYIATILNNECDWLTVTDNMNDKSAFDALFSGDSITVTFSGGTDADPINTDYIGDAGQKTGVHVFDANDSIRTLIVPDNVITTDGSVVDQQSVDNAMVSWCEGKEYVNYITVVPQGQDPATAKTTIVTTWNLDSKNLAVYWNWTKVTDPLTGSPKLIPPHGTAGGAWAETDADEEGVHKAPANVIAKNVIGLEFENVTEAEHGLLNDVGINAIIKYNGIRVMGARMRTSDPEWIYIHKRRTYQMFWTSIIDSLKWAVFEVKDGGNSGLFGKVVRNITAFFRKHDRRFVRNGALRNYQNPSEPGYYVICDESNNPPEQQGVLKVRWGVSIVDTAEMIEVESSLWDGKASNEIL